MRWEDWPDPQPGPGEVLIAVCAVGICGSDLHGYTGESGHRQPLMVMGHEATGEVIALGADVAEDVLGMRVVMRPILACGTCDQCRAGHLNRCRNRRFLGVTVDGAMAERVVLPLDNVLPLPDGVSFVDGALTEPLAVALHAAHQAGNLSGCSVLIAGSGPIGLLILAAAQEAGAGPIVMTDIIPKRRATAIAMGADAALDPTMEGWQRKLADIITVPEVDVAFDAVGIPATFNQALGTVRPGGTVVAIGGWRAVRLDLNQVVTREVRIQGTFNFSSEEFDVARRWLGEGRVEASALITDIRPLAEGAAVFARLVRGRGNTIKVVLTS